MLRIRALRAMAAALLAVTVLSTAALAAPGNGNGKALGHAKADTSKGSSAKSGPTEDNDDDGVPNAPDPSGDADNRHPSGKDKHVEAGGSGNQGNSPSEPDGDGHGPERDEGGVDKPGGSGGLDELDQDGNNGCGNDDDFEDDNEGLCLGRQRQTEVADETAGGDAADAVQPESIQAEGTTPDESEEVVAAALAAQPPADVLGIVIEALTTDDGDGSVAAGVLAATAPVAAGTGSELAFTGADARGLLIAMLILALTGGVLLLAGRTRARVG